MEIFDQDKANYYTSNRATFDPSDDLVLNDGVLWDVRVGKPVHKFDKFNAAISGLFHPMGLEIIINSEVVSFSRPVFFVLPLFKSFYSFTFQLSTYVLGKRNAHF